jgi:hypothetical protein
MFPDSNIAQHYQMAKDKLAYVVCHGLAPHFQKDVISRVNSAPEFALSFDEALNTISQKGQMDIWARFFNESVGLICTEYVTSVFLGHSKAKDLLQCLKAATGDIGAGLNLKQLQQLSMDGPAVNLLLYQYFSDEFLNNFEKELLNTGYNLLCHINFHNYCIIVFLLGICSLHVVSGALQAGMRTTGWDIQSILRAMYQLFKDSPARRADFQHITQCDVFPKSFCKIRWVENKDVCQRALMVLPHIRKYVQEVKPKPTINSFTLLQESLKDQFLEAKLHFFSAVAGQFEPFLRRFQNDKPLVPHLYSSLLTLIQDCAKRFLKPNVLLSIGMNYNKLKHLDYKDLCNLLDATKTDIGFGAKRSIPVNSHPGQR